MLITAHHLQCNGANARIAGDLRYGEDVRGELGDDARGVLLCDIFGIFA